MLTGMDWIDTAQAELKRRNLAAWLICDFRGNNPAAKRFLDFGDVILSRRVFLLVPSEGTPQLLVHEIERGSLLDLPFDIHSYSDRQSLVEELGRLLPPAEVALEYSPMNDNPYVSHVDAGTVELLRSLGVTPVSSADLLQVFSTWSDEQVTMHLAAAKHVLTAKDRAFAFIAEQVRAGRVLSETAVQKVITDYFGEHDLIYHHLPTVAFGPHAGNPHYAPQAGADSTLQTGDVILIDLWAKLPPARAPYADITWMGSHGAPSAEFEALFQLVVSARDLAVEAIQTAYREGRHPEGREIDRITRDFIAAEGYAEAFKHRTGHSLGTRFVHGDAVHLDDFETCDTRRLVPGIGITIEPGVYFDTFGVRSEINLLLEEAGPRVTTDRQRELVII